jgi:ribosomal protein S27E
MPGKTKSSKRVVCEQCAGTDLVRRITTYPVQLTGPLEGKEIHVGRVALHECRSCGHLMPTPAGQAKVERNVAMSIRLFLGQLH